MSWALHFHRTVHTLNIQLIPMRNFIEKYLFFFSFVAQAHAREDLKFPTMVNGFDRNGEHAARSALYTRYTPSEWHTSCLTSYAESDINRNHSERLRNDAIRLMRQTDEVTAQGQREAGRRLGERLTDLTFWRNELTIELEKCVAEYSLLADIKRRTIKAYDDLDAPLKIAEECLYFRENRQGIDKVHDIVEKSLLNEVQNLKSAQNRLKNCLDQVMRTLLNVRNFLVEFIWTKFVFHFLKRSTNNCRIYVVHNIHLKKMSSTKRTPLESMLFVIN